ncbi:MAG: stage V sporulation protein AC [Eubacteriales bacterium]
MKAEDYQTLVDKKTKNSPMLKDCILAYVIGGGICMLGQAFFDIYTKACNLPEETAGTFVSITLVFLTALFTGIGWFDELGKVAGAGTLVPITGFANAMVSPAVEFKTEGVILGIGPKLFSIAGSVIVYGTVAAFIYGLIYYVFTRLI